MRVSCSARTSDPFGNDTRINAGGETWLQIIRLTVAKLEQETWLHSRRLTVAKLEQDTLLHIRRLKVTKLEQETWLQIKFKVQDRFRD